MTRPIDSAGIVRVPLRSPVSEVTRRGSMSRPSLAIVEATSAIWSGVTNVSAWPYDALASSTSSLNPPGCRPSPLVTCEMAVGRSNGERRPEAHPLGVADQLGAAGPQPGQRVVDVARDLGRADQVERRRAGRRVVAVADPEAVDEQAVPLGRGWRRNVVSGVIASEPSPATAVTILNTDPGTYRPSVARGRSGCGSSACSASNVVRAVAGLAMADASYVGVEARARISPVCADRA